MAPHDLVRALGASRILFGTAAVVSPRLSAGPFLGSDAGSPAASVLGRALGARDALIGGMVIHTAGHPQVGRRWVASCAAIDLVDGLAAVAARRGLPTPGGVAFAAIAISSAVGHAVLSQALAKSDDAPATETATPAPDAAPVQARTAPAEAADGEVQLSPPDPAAAVEPDGADVAKRAMGAREISVEGSPNGGIGSGAGPGSDSPQTGGAQI